MNLTDVLYLALGLVFVTLLTAGFLYAALLPAL